MLAWRPLACLLALHFLHRIQMDNHQGFVNFWDCGFVIPWLFSPSNCYFPFQTRSHKMESGGGSRPPPPFSRSHIASHHVASHRKASHAAQLSSSQTSRGSCTDPQYKARATTAKNHARAHAAARATRWPIPDRTLHPGNPARPPQPARTITGPGSNGLQLLGEDADRQEGRRGCSAAWQLRGCPPTCRSMLIHQDQDEHDGRAVDLLHLEEAAAPQLLCRSRSSNGSSDASPRHALPLG